VFLMMFLFILVGALYDIGLKQKLYLGCQGTGVPTGSYLYDSVLFLVKNFSRDISFYIFYLVKLCLSLRKLETFVIDRG